jgi:hypothetical protein
MHLTTQTETDLSWSQPIVQRRWCVMADSLTTAVRRAANPNAKPRQLRLCFALALFWACMAPHGRSRRRPKSIGRITPSPSDRRPATAPGQSSRFPRAMSMINYFACGQENEFLSLALDPSAGSDGTGATFINDGVLYRVMAKLTLLKRGATECAGIFNVVAGKGQSQGSVKDFFNSALFPELGTFSNMMQQTFGTPCTVESLLNGKTGNSFDVEPPKDPSSNPFATVTTHLTAGCLKAQIEFVLSQVSQGDFQPGSSDIPCHQRRLGYAHADPRPHPPSRQGAKRRHRRRADSFRRDLGAYSK